MAQSGNWFGNAIMWYLGYIIIMCVEYYLGWLKWFGVWQFQVDLNFEVMKAFFPTDLVGFEGMMSDMSRVDG